MNRLLPLGTDAATRAWLAVACFMLAATLVLVPAAFIDARTLEGVNVWTKPVKFSTSLALHFATLALLLQLVSPAARGGRMLVRFVQISVAAALFEIVYIGFQALRGRPSHFNFDTGFETGMYALMGIGATLLVVTPFVLGLVLLRQRDGERRGVETGGEEQADGDLGEQVVIGDGGEERFEGFLRIARVGWRGADVFRRQPPAGDGGLGLGVGLPGEARAGGE